MESQGGFWFMLAIEGDGYKSGLFLMGNIVIKPDRVTAVMLLNADDECSLRWASGRTTDLYGSMPRKFLNLGLQHGVLLHWRSDQDETIQRELLPLLLA